MCISPVLTGKKLSFPLHFLFDIPSTIFYSYLQRMTAAILVNTLVTLASIEMAFIPHPSEVSFTPPAEEVLAATSVPSPTLTSTPTPTPTQREYITKSGDTIRRIAKNEYGSELYWTLIWDDNPDLTDPTLIHPGLKLLIRTNTPSKPTEPVRPLPTEAPTPTPTVVPSSTSVVQSGSQTGSPIGNFASVYMDAGVKYGIPWQILYAMHKVESGLRDGPVDSGAGPQGPLQFLPSTWAVHGVDGNGDGNADINSAQDAIHSAANYLSKHPTIESGLNSYGRIKDDVYRIAKENGWTE